MHEIRVCLTFLLLGFIFDDILGPKNDYLFCLVYISILALKNGICNTVFYSVASWKSPYFSKVRSIDTRSRR